MKELIKIKEENGSQLVSARELYEFLGIGRDFTTWCKQMFEYGFNENIDYSLCSPDSGNKQKGRGGHNAIDYALTIDCAKEISMIQRSDKGKQARLYFIECEKKLNTFDKIPKDYPSALRALAAEFERAELAESKVQQLLPKGEAYDRFMQYEGFFTLKQVADLFDIPGMGRNEFMKMLRKDKILSSNNEPYRYHQNLGRFKTCLQDSKDKVKNGKFIPRYNTIVSPKGVEFLFEKYKSLVKDTEEFDRRKYQLIEK